MFILSQVCAVRFLKWRTLCIVNIVRQTTFSCQNWLLISRLQLGRHEVPGSNINVVDRISRASECRTAESDGQEDNWPVAVLAIHEPHRDDKDRRKSKSYKCKKDNYGIVVLETNNALIYVRYGWLFMLYVCSILKRAHVFSSLH